MLRMKLKRFFLMVLLGVVAFVVINVVAIAMQSPEAADQQVIADCWTESKKDTLTPEKRQIVVGACQALEKAYQLNYGVKLTLSSDPICARQNRHCQPTKSPLQRHAGCTSSTAVSSRSGGA